MNCCKLSDLISVCLRAWASPVWSATYGICPENKAAVHEQLMSETISTSYWFSFMHETFLGCVTSLRRSPELGITHFSPRKGNTNIRPPDYDFNFVSAITATKNRRVSHDIEGECEKVSAGCVSRLWCPNRSIHLKGCSLWNGPAPQMSATWMLMRAPLDVHKLND